MSLHEISGLICMLRTMTPTHHTVQSLVFTTFYRPCKKRAVHLNFECPVCPELLLLMHTMKILRLVLTHHSKYHLHGSVLMSHKGGLMCYLPHSNQGAPKCRHIHRQNQRLHCHLIFYSVFFRGIPEHFSSTPCKIFMKR